MQMKKEALKNQRFAQENINQLKMSDETDS